VNKRDVLDVYLAEGAPLTYLLLDSSHLVLRVSAH